MGRPKGSKNQKRVVKKIDPVDAEIKASKGQDISDLKVKEPVKEKSATCRTCGHAKDLHYGSQHNWCNATNCRCGAWAE